MRFSYSVGVDEVGRGPLAGPITVCALAVPRGFNMGFFKKITDSKKLSPAKREDWTKKIRKAKKKRMLNFALASVSAGEIDKKGLSKAARKAVRLSLLRLKTNLKRSHIFLDGSLYAPKHYKHQKTIVGGDESHALISAASVVAKVYRDGKMRRLAKEFPNYGFEIHKGYGTALHRKRIKKYKPCALHRRSFLN